MGRQTEGSSTRTILVGVLGVLASLTTGYLLWSLVALIISVDAIALLGRVGSDLAAFMVGLMLPFGTLCSGFVVYQLIAPPEKAREQPFPQGDLRSRGRRRRAGACSPLSPQGELERIKHEAAKARQRSETLHRSATQAAVDFDQALAGLKREGVRFSMRERVKLSEIRRTIRQDLRRSHVERQRVNVEQLDQELRKESK